MIYASSSYVLVRGLLRNFLGLLYVRREAKDVRV